MKQRERRLEHRRKDFNTVNAEPTKSRIKTEMNNQRNTVRIREKWNGIKTILKNTIDHCIPEETRQKKQDMAITKYKI